MDLSLCWSFDGHAGSCSSKTPPQSLVLPTNIVLVFRKAPSFDTSPSRLLKERFKYSKKGVSADLLEFVLTSCFVKDLKPKTIQRSQRRRYDSLKEIPLKVNKFKAQTVSHGFWNVSSQIIFRDVQCIDIL